MHELAGKAAFVTGGASGIGLALCRVFAKAGIKIMLADIEKEVLDTAMASLEGIGTEVRGVLCDVADPVSVDKAAEAAFTTFGKIHIVCNNAGVAGRGGINDISLANWRWVLDVNLMGWSTACARSCRIFGLTGRVDTSSTRHPWREWSMRGGSRPILRASLQSLACPRGSPMAWRRSVLA
jgi:NAD(P)-dependent dehydrogenase (short-subunit alcohol dehydrogenase family)